VVREAFAAVVGLTEPVPLQHGAHRAVEDEDAAGEQVGEQGEALGAGHAGDRGHEDGRFDGNGNGAGEDEPKTNGRRTEEEQQRSRRRRRGRSVTPGRVTIKNHGERRWRSPCGSGVVARGDRARCGSARAAAPRGSTEAEEAGAEERERGRLGDD
jgi:hypothetical protein